MNIFVDENMPFANEFFSSLGNVTPFAGRKLTANTVKNADVLLVRSITEVNQSLIGDCQQLSFVGSATIGFDHVDRQLLANKNIPFYSAPGCNAISVADYVLSALIVLSERYQFDLRDKSVGIIGAGNTGSRVAEKLKALGINYVLHDPLLEQCGDPRQFVDLDTVLSADIISLHVPKTMYGPYPTFHLLNDERLANLRQDQILLNCCRGEVVDNNALLALKQAGHQLKLVLDVWENEPNPLESLIDYTDIATAHIAGYSLEGKSRGTEMLYQALCREKNIESSYSLSQFLPQIAFAQLKVNKLAFTERLKLMQFVYDVRRDDAIFRNNLCKDGFDTLRKSYPVRRENSALTINTLDTDEQTILSALGFSVLP